MKVFLILIILSSNLSHAFGQWENVGHFSDINVNHAVGFSYLDKGYIVTGSTDTSQFIGSKNFYEYNSLTDVWTQKEDFPGALRSYAIGDFYGDKMYLGFGGNVQNSFNAFNDLWSYDPQTDEWEELAECPCEGRLHPSFNALDGKIYVGLGSSPNGGDLEDFWEYDIAGNSWTEKAVFMGGKRHHPYHFAVENHVYVGLGHAHAEGVVKDDWFQYDPISDTWEQMEDLPALGRVAGTQLVYNGYGFALSGFGHNMDSGFHTALEEGEFWMYDHVSDAWDQMPSHPGESRYAPASFVINNYVYIVSGVYSESSDENQVMRFEFEDATSSTNQAELVGIVIYPNPYTEYIQLDIPESIETPLMVEILDLNGSVLFSETINQHHVKIAPNLLSKHLYFMKLISENNIQTIKIVRK